MSNTIIIVLLIVSFILLLGGIALCGFFLHEEIDKKKGKEIHIYYIIAGVILVALGVFGVIFMLRQKSSNDKIAIPTGALADKEGVLSTGISPGAMAPRPRPLMYASTPKYNY